MMDSKLAILIAKPSAPCPRIFINQTVPGGKQNAHTVTADPHINVVKALISPGFNVNSSTPNSSIKIPFVSPAMTIRGINTIALSRFVYHDRANADPFTTPKLCLMTTECVAVIAEEVTPKKMPIGDTSVPSRNTPMKKPRVTNAQERRMRREGRVCKTRPEVATVKGNTKPRATW